MVKDDDLFEDFTNELFIIQKSEEMVFCNQGEFRGSRLADLDNSFNWNEWFDVKDRALSSLCYVFNLIDSIVIQRVLLKKQFNVIYAQFTLKRTIIIFIVVNYLVLSYDLVEMLSIIIQFFFEMLLNFSADKCLIRYQLDLVFIRYA